MNKASHNPVGGARQIERAYPGSYQILQVTTRSGAQGRFSSCRVNPTTFRSYAMTEISEMSSAGQAREERDRGNPRSSRAFSDDCENLVHELANTITAVLVNVQVLGWKLPPYSRLKRPLREIERNAQRGGELMKRLLTPADGG